MDEPAAKVDLSSLDIGAELGQGGQGTVSDVRGTLIDGKWRAVLKQYSPEALAKLNPEILEKFVLFARQLPPQDKNWLYGNYAWPVSLVMSGNRVGGFLMRRVPTDYTFDFHTQTLGVRRKLSDVAFLLNSDDYVRNAGLRVTDRDRLRILETVATNLSRLHNLDVTIGDLSPKNVLFRLQPYPSSFFIDCDSFRLKGETALEQLETTDWEAPAGQQKATVATDSYKFGLLAIRLFARDQATHDAAAISALSPVLGRLAALSQDADPGQWPTPGTWVGALNAVASSIPSAPSPPWPPPAPKPPRPWAGAGSRLARRLLTRASIVVLSGILVLSILLAFVIFPAVSGSSPPPPAKDPAAQQEAAAINALLDGSAASQGELELAMNHVEACSGLPGDDSQIAAVAGQRASQLSDAYGISVAGLANATSLKSYLVQVLDISSRADQDYLNWVNEIMARGCSARTLQDGAYASGYALTEDVVAAKLDFLHLWNPVAGTYGFPVRTQSDL
ncbi:MAG TPA: hypothetical protein VMI33_16700 [Streptosporangiaceae bacterium]|nr:hypothetical protein [Streptosporangiaceae bacterium]